MEQLSRKMKKICNILVAVLFLVSLTVAASGAQPDHKHKHLEHTHLGGNSTHNDHDDNNNHDDNNDHNNDHNNHQHDDDDCWAWSPTKEQWVYIC